MTIAKTPTMDLKTNIITCEKLIIVNLCQALRGPLDQLFFANRKMGAGLIGLAISMNRSLRKDRQSETLPHYFGQPWKQHQMSPV